MAEDINKSISSTNSGFPDYLNFDKLRSEAIDYLGNLSGKIWTDHNVHDPGITILEVLIYALLDLGYRTNLPPVDLFTRNPDDQSKDNNFFTPAQILANNPLTITDYRKLLTDIEGVKNAWLEIDDDTSVDFCGRHIENHLTNIHVVNENAICRDDLLNGLYHVFIQTEKDFDTNIPEEKENYEALIAKIKCALMSHRNLCEDFIDIKILCRFKIGLCADIELEPDADGEEVYLRIVAALQEFFSPSPKFYTLQQLLERQKPIEDIFAGRPFNVTESHGFVDTNEFEQIELKRIVRLSDVYHVLFDVEGIKNVRNLSWKECDDQFKINDLKKWALQLPQNHIPEFSVPCSGFQFYKYGMKLKVDKSKYDPYLEMTGSGNGKVLYRQPSPYLDGEIPQGVYRDDLADYYSIQNEFPSVYGISEGALRNDASDERKAQALQLQGFLLFFDQLLANYLTQLKNIRSLFAFSSVDNGEDAHTYFINQLTNVPQFQKLLRFKTDANSVSAMGSAGNILAFPTSRKNFEILLETGKLKDTDLERNCNVENEPDFPEYKFCFGAVRDQAVNQLKEDLLYGSYEPVVVSNSHDCFFFYIFTSSTDFVLMSKRYYKNEKEALSAAASVKYTGTFLENFRNFMDKDCASGEELFSFSIGLNLDSYAKYLQLIIENNTLYTARRQDFLNHLLSRFAETFTTYALLGAGLLSNDELKESQIKAEEIFLGKYDDLSSNRGKGYNYLCDGWKNDNVSGFEKRFKALSGIEDWRKHYLCHFVVEENEALYKPVIVLQDKNFEPDTELNKPLTISSIKSVYSQLNSNPLLNVEFVDHDNAWQLFIKDDLNNKYVYSDTFKTKEDAALQRDLLLDLFSHTPEKSQNVFVSRYIFKIELSNHAGLTVAEYIGGDKSKLTDKAIAENKCKELTPGINAHLNNLKLFTWKEDHSGLGNLVQVSGTEAAYLFINEKAFEFYAVEDVNLTDDRKFRFKFRDVNKKILFESIRKYDTEPIAMEAFEQLLPLLAVQESYEAKENEGENTFGIYIKYGEEDQAVYFESFATQPEAQNKVTEIISEVDLYTYTLGVSAPVPDQWKFKFSLMDLSAKKIEFNSKGVYNSEENGFEASKNFYSDIPNLKLHISKEDLFIESEREKISAIWNNKTTDEQDLNEVKKEATSILQFHKDLLTDTSEITDEKLNAKLKSWQTNRNENYKFKLVDKDNLLAEHTPVNNVPNHEDTAGNVKKIRDSLFGQQYDFVDFNTAGNDIICFYEDEKTNKRWYHYRVKCTNRFYEKGDTVGKELVLFESIKGYATQEEALSAFTENLFIVLRYARNPDMYGDDQFISLKEMVIHENTYTSSKSMVFVPKQTLDELGGYEVQKLIVPVVKSYPVKYIAKDRFRFVLFNQQNDQYDWRSREVYPTAAQAMQAFQYFLILLKYKGNYYIRFDKARDRFSIFIREVLAESLHGFSTCAAAWGSEGIEKFICISQTTGGFHNYLDIKNCSNSFFVGCGNTGLIHPCKYETSKRRDEILKKLYQAASFNFFDLLQLENDILSLLDLDNKAIARILIEKNENNQGRQCDQLIDFFESVYVDDNYIVLKDDSFYLQNDSGAKIAEPASNEIKLEEWKQQLKKIACYFPLLRKERLRSRIQLCNYRLQIKLPGFDSCEDDKAPHGFGCGEKEDECKPGCYLAWKSDCCFDSCCDAIAFYLNALTLLGNYNNYKRVYECNCGDYGIELHSEIINNNNNRLLPVPDRNSMIEQWICDGFFNDNRDNFNNNSSDFNDGNLRINHCTNEIIAVNPQQYTSETMACEAVTRAKKLINSEGLHLVEHILLRPRCKNADGTYDDCGCDALPAPCVDQQNICHFEWKPGGDIDPCETDEKICFTPGYDPYSFIATLALPAWPQRFSSKENRAVVEKLLQTEAPAYVLLRILWLNPRDFCCFEYYFKRWNEWLAKKLYVDYDNCNFLEFLFNKNFEEITECKECVACSCDEKTPASCFENEDEPCDDFNLLSQLNQLFCWIPAEENNDHFENCESCSEQPALKEDAVLSVKRNQAIKKLPVFTEKVKPVKKVGSEKAPGSATITAHEKTLKIQARSHAYKENVKKVIEANPGNPVARNALTFLSNTNPGAKLYDDLINRILKNKTDKAKNIKALSLSQKQELIQNTTWQYLDRICFNSKELSKITSQQSLFNHLRKNKIDMHDLFEGWKSDEIKKLEPGINIMEIKKQVMG